MTIVATVVIPAHCVSYDSELAWPVSNWLRDHAGARGTYPDLAQGNWWSYRWYDFDARVENFVFQFRDRHAALMFKIKWGV